MTNENKPNVMIVNGKPKIERIGLTKRFSKAKTIAKITAVPNVAICTPERKYFESKNATPAVISNLIIKFII